jgi:MSHA biogenesis protein MshK
MVGAAAPRLFIRVSVFCLLSSVFCPLNAEDLPDPTRPPAFITGYGAAPGSASGQWSIESRSSGLQSTIISESRRAAIIDGKTVELWEKHGNAQLIEVNEGSVVLRTAQTRRVLTLFPDVKMTQRESKTKKASPESGVQPDGISTMPAAQYEKLLPGYPKEKK